MKFFSGLTGFGTADAGIKNAGITLVGGLEIDPAIAAVSNTNYGNGHVRVDDMITADPANYPFADWGHFSPSCITASNANNSAEVNEQGTKESAGDIGVANGIIKFIAHHRYKMVTIENVYGYRHYQSFKGGDNCEGIVPALRRMGYYVDWRHVNAADYGVPQTRHRLILIARIDRAPAFPRPTHNKKGFLSPWVGWHEAIADLIPTLPLAYKRKGQPCDWDANGLECRQSVHCRGHFADWQLDRIDLNAFTDAPFPLNTNQKGGNGVSSRNGEMPAFTSRPNDYGRLNAFIANGTTNNNGQDMTICSGSDPIFTITAGIGGKRVARAFLLGAGTRSTPPPAEMPADTLRAWLQRGIVVEITPRAAARLQSVPDWYKLPKNKQLAFKGVGNGVPSLLMTAIANANLTAG